MFKKKQKVLGGCLSVAFAVTSTFSIPATALASTNSSPTFRTSESIVERIYGVDRYETAAKVAQQGWSKSEYAVLAAGMDNNLVDALTAAPLAKSKNAPILLTEGDKLNAFTEKELTRLGVKKVYVTSGTGVINASVVNRLQELGIEAVRLGGLDRFETSVNIAKELDSSKKLVLATAWSNADALSVASIAAAKGMPILLTEVEGVPASVDTYINSVKDKVSKTYVLGGQGAISEGAKAEVPNPERVGGIDRYATNLEILKTFAQELKYGQGYVANGTEGHLVDALVAAPLAAQSGSGILLTDSTLPAESEEYAKLSLSPNQVALGGESVVSQSILDSITASTVYTEDNASLGSTDAQKPAALTGNVTISGEKVTLQNATLDHSLLIQGDQAKLSNVTVKGTVFIDLGDQGEIDLDNVKAQNIVVLPKDKNVSVMAATTPTLMIRFNNVSAAFLGVQGTGAITVQTTGNTAVQATVVMSAALLDAVAGSFGTVEVGTLSNAGTVEFKGTFTSVTITGQALVKAAEGSNIAALVVDTDTKAQTVTLEGKFQSVSVSTEGNLKLGEGTVVVELVTNADTNLEMDKTASVEKLESNGNNVPVSGDGADNVGTTPPVGGGGGSSDHTKPTFISFANGEINESEMKILLPAVPTKQDIIEVSEESDLTLTHEPQNGGVSFGTLGQFTLNGETSANSLDFSKVNLEDLNFTAILEVLKVADEFVKETIYDSINLTQILEGVRDGLDSETKGNVYTCINAILTAVSEDEQIVGRDLFDAVRPSVEKAVDLGILDDQDPNVVPFLADDETLSTIDFSTIDFTAIISAIVGVENQEDKYALIDEIDFTSLLSAVKADTDGDTKEEVYNNTTMIFAYLQNDELNRSIILDAITRPGVVTFLSLFTDDDGTITFKGELKDKAGNMNTYTIKIQLPEFF